MGWKQWKTQETSSILCLLPDWSYRQGFCVEARPWVGPLHFCCGIGEQQRWTVISIDRLLGSDPVTSVFSPVQSWQEQLEDGRVTKQTTIRDSYSQTCTPRRWKILKLSTIYTTTTGHIDTHSATYPAKVRAAWRFIIRRRMAGRTWRECKLYLGEHLCHSRCHNLWE